ncbi:lasso peptide biosynthesis B2 protein [Paramicrobacterium fandaimingii]|uniref:lasso peptide biosynthesis B2 protein n=1 Tax=Paramicrobacterium fandaimingii TaxID=2708079 RepID=UPI001420AE66|nr:lasso peptide biosynthesis B2 protein [Microbacterium fandaimingii]
MSLRYRVRTVLAYPPRRWADLVEAVAVAIRVESALRRGGVARAARVGHVHVLMDGIAAPTAPLAEVNLTPREREKLDTAWRLLRQPPFNGTCLRRAIVGGHFLRDRTPILRIGVSKENGVVAAHAWVEIDGVSLDPDGSERFSVLTAPTKGS